MCNKFKHKPPYREMLQRNQSSKQATFLEKQTGRTERTSSIGRKDESVQGAAPVFNLTCHAFTPELHMIDRGTPNIFDNRSISLAAPSGDICGHFHVS